MWRRIGCWCRRLLAYEVETHEAISKSAAGQSVLAAPSKLQEMGPRPTTNR